LKVILLRENGGIEDKKFTANQTLNKKLTMG